MARMPGTIWTGEHSPRRPMVRYDCVVLHTIVGLAPAHAAHFSVEGNGKIWQSRDTEYQSAANLNGNPRVIAIENEDHGPHFKKWTGSNVPAFTEAQVHANARILAWVHEEHGVPLQLCPDSRPGSRGLGYHRQGIDGNFGPFRFPGRVSGGEVWTEHFGKICPGDDRIEQRPLILELARQSAKPNQEDDDMTPAQASMLAKTAVDAAAARDLARRALARGQVNTRVILALADKSQSGIAKVLAEVAALDKADHEVKK